MRHGLALLVLLLFIYFEPTLPQIHFFVTLINSEHLPHFLLLYNFVLQRCQPLNSSRLDRLHVDFAVKQSAVGKFAQTALIIIRIRISLRAVQIALDIHLLAKGPRVDHLCGNRPKSPNKINFKKLSHRLKTAAQLCPPDYLHLAGESIIVSHTQSHLLDVGTLGKRNQQFHRVLHFRIINRVQNDQQSMILRQSLITNHKI